MIIPDIIEIKKSKNRGEGLYSKKLIKKGKIIFHFDGKLGDDASTNAESLQIDDNLFLESTVFFDDFLNHSCEPNSFIDWKTLNLIALKDIPKGEEITYNYMTSDWDDSDLLQDHSFKCNCGSKDCIGEMKGFRYLSLKQRSVIKKFLSPFLEKRFNDELKYIK